MNYLELVQRTIKESGAHLSVPDSLSGLDGLHSMFVDWVNQAWVELQLERPEWYFRMSEDSIRQINSTTLERGVKIPISRLPSEFAPNWNSIQLFDIYIRKQYKENMLYQVGSMIYSVGQLFSVLGTDSVEYDSPTKLCYIPWSSWASFMGKSQFHLDYNDQEEVIGRPEYFTITPTGEVWIYPIPDAHYEINIFGPKKIQELSEDTDEPYLESEYRLAIVFRALMEYALYHEDRSVFERARNKYRSYKKALEHRYMPDINLNTSSLYRDIC